MGALKRGETQAELIERAGMDCYGFNTGVVRATDGGPRIAVNGHMNNRWGDCIAIGFMFEGKPEWHYSHLSPARARVLASHLLRLAAMKEKGQPYKIDAQEPRAVAS